MKTCSFLAIVLLCGASSLADDTSARASAKARVEEINEALLKGKFDRIVELTHPKIVELAGGREKMTALLESSINKMKDDGFAFLSSKVEEPSGLTKRGADLYVVVPFVLEMKAPGGKVTSPGFVVGVSSDLGKSWTFINNPPGEKSLKDILPDLPDDLKLPARKQPKFEKD